ncbi:MAG TPA: LLM class F420-dependent oxidoreductase [Acidimicrobiales bacterium]|nr:LLM class F420-dependent oxidoreductase [Acidimicrobiales bacterium]
MRIGIHATASPRADNAIDGMVAAARAAHEGGLDLWTPQLMDVDALTALAVVAREVPGLHVGTAVVPTYPRHPLMLASQALTVAAAAPGRFTLGIGLSHQVVMEGSFGYSFAKPVRHLREYLEVLMPALAGEAVRHQGEVFTASTMAPIKVAGGAPPPVLVAALGSQTLSVAGRLADGTALWLVGPRTIESHIVPRITEAAERAGRPRPRVAVGLPVCVTSDVDGARARAAAAYAFYNDLPSYRAMLDREGAAGPADVAVVGDEDAVADRLRHLGQIGATDLSLPVFGSPDERQRTHRLLAALASEQG